jgi:hypothetical protein
MHLMYENVIPALFRHFRGVFFSSNAKRRSIVSDENEMNPDELGGESDVDSEELDESLADVVAAAASGTSSTVSPSQKQSNSPKKPAKKGAEKMAKFIITDDPWNILPDDWTEVGKAFEDSAAFYPLAFGDPLRNFTRHCHELKAAEWAIVTKHAAPIFLKMLLPDEDYEGFLYLVDAIALLEKASLTTAEQERIGSLLDSFSRYYEARFYRKRWDRLRVCLPTFHQLLHMKDATVDLGPAYVFWQLPMER